MTDRVLTYYIDDRRRLAADLAADRRLTPERVREIARKIPEFKAEVRLRGTPDCHSIHIGGPNGRDILAEECPHYITAVTMPEIVMHFRGDELSRGRRLPFAVAEIKY